MHEEAAHDMAMAMAKLEELPTGNILPEDKICKDDAMVSIRFT